MKTKIISSAIAFAILIGITDIKAQATIGSNTLTGTAPNPTQYLGSSNGYNLLFKTNNKEHMRIINASGNATMPNGNINIGPIVNTSQVNYCKVTINPALNINNIGDDLVGLSIAKQISTPYSRSIFFVPHIGGGFNYLNQNGDCAMLWTDGGNGVAGALGNRNVDAGLVIGPWTNGYTGIRITKTGNVGIGTPLISNTNNYKLAVNGIIGAKAVKIEVSSDAWPDYVFDKKYKLKSISELEHFVNINKHLPNVPSACEVEDNGVDLGNMDAKLLEKIEELYLYIIEQNKRIVLLEKKIDKK